MYVCLYIYICLHSWNPFVLFVFLQTNVFFPIWVYRFTSVFLLLEGSPAMKPLLNCETSGVLMSISSSGFCGKTCRTGNPVFWDRLFLSKNDWLVGCPNKFRINILWIKYVEVWWRYNYEIITWWSLSFTKFFHRPSRFCWFLIISSHRNFFHPLQGLNLQVQKQIGWPFLQNAQQVRYLVIIGFMEFHCMCKNIYLLFAVCIYSTVSLSGIVVGDSLWQRCAKERWELFR